MKSIVIIENEKVQLDSLVKLFNQWQRTLNIITATDQQTAISIMSRQPVDLVLCDLSSSATFTLSDFSRLTQTFPYIPCITFSDQHGPQPEKVLEYGASHCLVKPLDIQLLVECANEILEGTPTGTTEGIPVHSFLQMLESEGQTCTLEVSTSEEQGFLYIKKGELISGETKTIFGEAAARLILSWADARLRLLYFNGQYKRQITKDLLSIIMESFELSSSPDQNQSGQKKHVSTPASTSTCNNRGKKLPLRLGVRIKIFFFDLDTELVNSLIGIVRNNSIIVENPIPENDWQTQLNDERVMVKYVYKGKMWMFKSQLLEATNTPVPLLFLEYPKVIHYHELRKTKRSTIFIPSTFHLQGEKELFGVLIGMSLTGSTCQVKHKSEVNIPVMDIDSTVILRCLLPGIPDEQQLYGKVKNMKIEHGETRIGVEFDSLQPQLTNTIGKYL